MTSSIDIVALSDVTFSVHRAGTALSELSSIESVYASAYAEAPYNEGPDDVVEFAKGWPARVSQPSFRLVIARRDDRTVGFAFGHQLTPTTLWWRGMLGDVERDVVTEYEGRTFAVIELAVDAAMRNHGIGRELHAHLLAGLREERATLLVRPEATAARRAYLSWSYHPLGQLRPFTDGPVYEAMIKPLPAEC
jgi:ribosomal protein S18 acetylase RimI-like enzyme